MQFLVLSVISFTKLACLNITERNHSHMNSWRLPSLTSPWMFLSAWIYHSFYHFPSQLLAIWPEAKEPLRARLQINYILILSSFFLTHIAFLYGSVCAIYRLPWQLYYRDRVLNVFCPVAGTCMTKQALAFPCRHCILFLLLAYALA